MCLPSVDGVIKRWPNCGTSNHYKAHLDWAVTEGVVKLTREKAQSIGRPRTYVVLSPPSIELPTFSFQEALDYAQVLLNAALGDEAQIAARCSDGYGMFVSLEGRVKTEKTQKSDKQLEFGTGRSGESDQSRLTSISYQGPAATGSPRPTDNEQQDNPFTSSLSSSESSSCEHALQGHHNLASAGADLEQSSGNCSSSLPSDQSVDRSVAGQEQFFAAEAAALEQFNAFNRRSSKQQRKRRPVRRQTNNPPHLNAFRARSTRVQDRTTFSLLQLSTSQINTIGFSRPLLVRDD